MSFIPGTSNIVAEFWFGGDGETMLPDYRIFGLDERDSEDPLGSAFAVAAEEGVPRSEIRGIRIMERIPGSESEYPWRVITLWSPDEDS